MTAMLFLRKQHDRLHSHDDDHDDITGSTDTGATTGTGGACSRIPEETAGPYPGDGSNGANVLNQTGVVRQDIRSSFAGLSGAATGIPSSATAPPSSSRL